MLTVDLFLSSMTLPDMLTIPLTAALIGYLVTNCWVTLTQYPVYDILTWRTGFSAALVIGACAYAIVAFFATSGIAYFRDRLAGGRQFRDEAEGYHGPCATCTCCCRGRQKAVAAAGDAPPAMSLMIPVGEAAGATK